MSRRRFPRKSCHGNTAGIAYDFAITQTPQSSSNLQTLLVDRAHFYSNFRTAEAFEKLRGIRGGEARIAVARSKGGRAGFRKRKRDRDLKRKERPSRAAAREGGPNNISKLMSCGALQRGPVGSAPPFCIR